jgi:hypothetical protein
MEKFIEQTEEYNNSTIYTPESIAWELLFGNIDEEKKGNLLNYTNDINYNNIDDPVTFTYEILITIFMELLFNIAKMDYWSESDNNIQNHFIPDYKKFNMSSYISIINDKLKIIGYCMFIKEDDMSDFIYDKESLKTIIDNRYCRIVLRYHDNDDHFESNNISDDIYYHMKLNGLNENKYLKLNDVYSVIFLNEKIYRLSFEKI